MKIRPRLSHGVEGAVAARAQRNSVLLVPQIVEGEKIIFEVSYILESPQNILYIRGLTDRRGLLFLYLLMCIFSTSLARPRYFILNKFDRLFLIYKTSLVYELKINRSSAI